MSLIFNGTEVETIIYNDKNNSNVVLDELIIDSTQVYTRSITLKISYGSNVSSVKVNNSTISNGGTFEYQSGQTLSIVVTYDGYVTGDGYIHSVNNNTTVNSTRWKYNTNYTISGISKTVSVSSNLSTTSDTISFSLTDTEVSNLQSTTNTITFNATKTGTQTYKSSTTSTFTPDTSIVTYISNIMIRTIDTDNTISVSGRSYTITLPELATNSIDIAISGYYIGSITYTQLSGTTTHNRYTLHVPPSSEIYDKHMDNIIVKGLPSNNVYVNGDGIYVSNKAEEITKTNCGQTVSSTTYYWE